MMPKGPPFSRFRLVSWFLIGAFFILAVKVHHRVSQWDFAVYYRAAQRLGAGENPYHIEIPPGYENITILTAYVYPPFFARCLYPIGLLPEAGAQWFWFLVQAFSFECLYWFGLKLAGRRPDWISYFLFHLIGIRYDGVETDFRAGNTALLESAVLAAWGAFHLLKPWAAGIGLGVLLAVKPLTVFVTLWDLVGERWKSCLAVAATLGILGAIMVLDQPVFSQYREFLGTREFQEILDEHTSGIYNNATVSVAFRLFSDNTLFWPLWDFPPLAYGLTFAVPIATWSVAFGAWRRLGLSGLPVERANELGFYLLMPTCLLTTPRVADYTLVWLLVPFFFGMWRSWEGKDRAATVLFLLAGLVGNLPLTGGQIDASTWEIHLLQFRYVSLVLFWFAGWRLVRSQSNPVRASQAQQSLSASA